MCVVQKYIFMFKGTAVLYRIISLCDKTHCCVVQNILLCTKENLCCTKLYLYVQIDCYENYIFMCK